MESWESLTSQVSGIYWRVPLQPPISWGCFHSFCSPQGFSPFPPPNNWPFFPLSFPVPFLSQVPQSLSPVIAFFSFPSGTEAFSLGPFRIPIFLYIFERIIHILFKGLYHQMWFQITVLIFIPKACCSRRAGFWWYHVLLACVDYALVLAFAIWLSLVLAGQDVPNWSRGPGR